MSPSDFNNKLVAFVRSYVTLPSVKQYFVKSEIGSFVHNNDLNHVFASGGLPTPDERSVCLVKHEFESAESFAQIYHQAMNDADLLELQLGPKAEELEYNSSKNLLFASRHHVDHESSSATPTGSKKAFIGFFGPLRNTAAMKGEAAVLLGLPAWRDHVVRHTLCWSMNDEAVELALAPLGRSAKLDEPLMLAINELKDDDSVHKIFGDAAVQSELERINQMHVLTGSQSHRFAADVVVLV
ncbi:unnamed protein product [Mycena citricolor]|uniref:Uncharacterized protein n=1 Tax=Mycena citricolor TaxID=2018698 RepID=A0AAD2H4E9_9AGAR|nr:unnamed protein product [Mycena citricolor]